MAEKEDQLIKVLGILSESVRFKILSLIASRGEITAKDILSEFDFTQPTLSHHMSCLEQAGLVNVERKGRFAFYSVNKDTIDLVASAILSLKSSSKKALKEKHGSEPDTGEKKGGKKKKKKDKNKKKKKD
ncbi:MAG: metalloregulator ArsR/SmtB family transcription factor [Saccharofermentans sp.]|nr:metalloregulator ArsR/SmtB family transcription factor [Saccharofermentans sp.]